jgi:hypothetical protein
MLNQRTDEITSSFFIKKNIQFGKNPTKSSKNPTHLNFNKKQIKTNTPYQNKTEYHP